MVTRGKCAVSRHLRKVVSCGLIMKQSEPLSDSSGDPFVTSSISQRAWIHQFILNLVREKNRLSN